MKSSNLRLLAREYAEGKLEKGEYRELRARLLKDIMAGKTRIESHEQGDSKPLSLRESVLPQPASDSGESTEAGPSSENDSENEWIHDRRNIVYAGAGGIIILLVAVFILITNRTTPISIDDIDTSASEQSAVLMSEIPDTYIIEDLIERFLKKNDWSIDSREAFLENWSSLTSEEQAAALELPISNQLSNEIYERLLEQRALYKLDKSKSAIRNQKMLVNFAKEIGIDDPRIKVEDSDESYNASQTTDVSSQGSTGSNFIQ